MIIIGAGRIGTSLQHLSAEHDIDVDLVSRDSGWDSVERSPPGDPILVATRNDDLLEVIERVPTWLHDDLIFVQNGAVRGLIRNNGLTKCTRGLLYFAARGKPGPIEPGGVSWFCGDHALTMARWMALIGLRGEAVDWARFSYYELEKLTWICVMGAICDKHQCTVGEAVERHAAELEPVIAEFLAYGRFTMSVHPPLDFLRDRIFDYSRSIPEYRASVKEWRWRNGAVLRDMWEHDMPMPAHVRLLVEAGHKDRIPPELIRR